jgi:PAS domain S-box-containing protein
MGILLSYSLNLRHGSTIKVPSWTADIAFIAVPRVLNPMTQQVVQNREEKYQALLSRDLRESRDSGAKYRGLLEAAPDAIVVVNTAGEIVLLNVRAEKQFGYRRNELVGQKVTNIIPAGFAERLIADGTRTAAEALAQQIGTGIEFVVRRKDGSEFPIEIMLSPLEKRRRHPSDGGDPRHHHAQNGPGASAA